VLFHIPVFKNALLPTLVTVLGIVTAFISVWFSKAEEPIAVIGTLFIDAGIEIDAVLVSAYFKPVTVFPETLKIVLVFL